MSDYETGNESARESGVKESGKTKFEKMTEGPFFTLSRPYLDFIGKDKIFSIVYIVIAIINLIIPFIILYQAIDNHLFSSPAKYVFALILTWFVIVFAFWIGFQLWWNRRKNVVNVGISEFIAISYFSGILQTLGEWLGTLVAIIGAGGGIIGSIFLGNEIRYLFYYIPGLNFLANFGPAIIIVGPLVGFFIIVISRFIAEQLRIFAALADNTKEIAANIKKK